MLGDRIAGLPNLMKQKKQWMISGQQIRQFFLPEQGAGAREEALSLRIHEENMILLTDKNDWGGQGLQQKRGVWNPVLGSIATPHAR
ncbi:hypothetical protein AAJCM20276_16390 [Acetobacter aceti]|uniref:Uncharacterized protein n=1 Tax=Acetobacter aceti TaxID=435 RepID=A0A6S6PJZ7_ACEAC|nr:hypothetical protein AAJCM20276_16390 [Acetobacter aceti]